MPSGSLQFLVARADADPGTVMLHSAAAF